MSMVRKHRVWMLVRCKYKAVRRKQTFESIEIEFLWLRFDLLAILSSWAFLLRFWTRFSFGHKKRHLLSLSLLHLSAFIYFASASRCVPPAFLFPIKRSFIFVFLASSGSTSCSSQYLRIGTRFGFIIPWCSKFELHVPWVATRI